MRQLFRVSTTVAIIAAAMAAVSAAMLFFLIEPPFLASIFLACSLIAILCFGIAAIGAYFME
jgi:hypothetical protein